FEYPPQLVVVDGGQPQVAAAQRALDELGIVPIRVPWGQLQTSRAHPRTAFCSWTLVSTTPATIKEGYSGSGRRCSRIGRLLPQLPTRKSLFHGARSDGVSGFIAVAPPGAGGVPPVGRSRSTAPARGGAAEPDVDSGGGPSGVSRVVRSPGWRDVFSYIFAPCPPHGRGSPGRTGRSPRSSRLFRAGSGRRPSRRTRTEEE
ncbi:hypothetical protein, partial [Streptomyces sp. NPDC006324]|uniref:hypothetical protein n=1 Tax=Streptomyces sp. NPDC006324 TaxID=3156751 RepID=UPI0033B5D79D